MAAKSLTFLGTDTEVGKTYQACILAKALRTSGKTVGVYKPVCSGADEAGATDAHLLREAADFQGPIDLVCPQFFKAPLAPPVAAQLEHRCVDESLLLSGVQEWLERDCLLVETAGGVLSPISESLTCCDLAERLSFPVVLVVPNRLGMVNQALMALEVIQSRDLDLVGLIVNSPLKNDEDASQASNRSLLAKFTSVSIHDSAEEFVDWFA